MSTLGYLTSDELITSIKRRASVPSTQTLFTDQDFLDMCSEELKIGLVPEIMKVHEEYFVHYEDITLVASTSNYDIPYRAIGGKLRDLFYKDSNGDLHEMTRISPENRVEFQTTAANTNFQAYYIQGNEIVLVPSVDTAPTGSIRTLYYLRPNELVAESRVAIITAIAVGASTTTYTVDAVPYSSGTTYMATTDLLDIIQAKSGHKTKDFDLTSTAIDTALKTITFTTADLPTGIVVGDHICFAGECIIPQVPSDLHVILAARVASAVMEALGDMVGLQSANAKLAQMEQKTTMLIDNRVSGDPLKVTNRKGLLGRSKIGRRR